MHTNNSKVKSIIISVYFVLIVFAILMMTIFKAFKDTLEDQSLLLVIVAASFAVLFIVVHYVSKYFEYDSDGLNVVVINRGLLFSDQFNYREQLLEFEKNELYDYEFKNYFVYKTLTFYLKNKRDKKTKAVFNVTLVNRKKRRYIRQSLNKMVKSNKKTAQINE